jgi:hypothetical protein
MDHDVLHEVPITLPEGTRPPARFRICQATPPLAAILVDEAPMPADGTYDWPAGDGAPRYEVDLGAQVAVEDGLYEARQAEIVVETCTRFCEGPFRTNGGNDYESWSGSGVCQWAE